jgi:hypothetical protein
MTRRNRSINFAHLRMVTVEKGVRASNCQPSKSNVLAVCGGHVYTMRRMRISMTNS